MDRVIVYTNELMQEADLLNTNKSTMIAMGKLTDAILGSSTLLNRLTCTPTTPASLSVLVNPGEIYITADVDDTAYSVLPIDNTHQIQKQGILYDAVTLSCPAPTTTGFSINYLVQIGFNETDTSASSRQFKDPITGAITTVTKNQVRQDKCMVAVKAGAAAATGTQTTPTPDAGYIGAYVVTVANGQTTITSGNITTYTNAPFLTERLTDKISLATGDARYLRNYNLVARASLAAAQTINNTSTDKVLLDTKSFDPANIIDTTNHRMVPGVTGYYQINAAIGYASITAGNFLVHIYVNGSSVAKIESTGEASPANQGFNVSDIIQITSTTDYIELYGQNVSGSAVNLLSTPTSTFLSLCKVG